MRKLFITAVTVFLFFNSVVFADDTPPMSLLVLSKGDTSLSIVDVSTMKVVGHAFAGQDPHEVIASADGKLAFISNYGGFGAGFHTLSVIDLLTQKPLAPVDLGALSGPHGLAIAGGKIYFTAEKNKMIGRYDPAIQKIDWLLGIGQNRTHMIVVSKDEKQIFTSNVNSNTINIIERGPLPQHAGPPPGAPPGGARPNGPGPNGPGPGGPPPGNNIDWIVTSIPVGDGPEGFDVSPDGKEVWAANSHAGTVSIIDVSTKSVVQTIPDNTRAANRLKFTPDGKLVLISDLGGNDLVVMDAVSRTEIKRMDMGHGCAGILMQPDGERAYVAGGDDVSVIDLKTLTIVGHITTGKGTDGMCWALRP